jgi:hypothetical protein
LAKKKKEDFLASEIEKEINEIEVSEDVSEEAVAEKEPEQNSDSDSNKSDSNKKEKFSSIKKILHSRKFARGWLFGAVIAVFLACVIAVNIIASVLEDKFPALSIDITSSDMYQLQEDTEKLCSSVEKDITIYLLMEEDTFTGYDSAYVSNGIAYFTQANQFFKEIAAQSSHITFKYKDISSDPSFATNYSNLNLNTTGQNIICILDAGDDNYKGLELDDLFTTEYDEDSGYTTISESKVEQAICTAIISLTQKKASKAYFVSSSGIPSESDSSTGETTYSALKTLLKNQAYDTGEIDLDSKEEVPDDCDILFFVGPSKDISEKALEKLNNYLDTAETESKTFVYIPSPYTYDDGTPNMDSFLEENGMKLEESWVYEESDSYLTSLYPDEHRLSTYDYDDEDFTSGIDSTSKVLMGNTKPITFTDSSTASSLLNTSEKADILPLTAESVDDVQEGTGEAMCGAAINRSEVETGIYKNVVVIGSYYAISDSVLTGMAQYNNANYFANMFNVLTENEGETVTITSATASDTSLGLESASQVTAPAIIFLGIVPIGVLAIGIIIWAIRRKK